jgi:hypothetical protein
MDRVRQGFQTFSSRVRGFFGRMMSVGLCQSVKVPVSAPVDLSGARILDVSGVDLSGSVVTNDAVIINSEVIKALPKILKECNIENSQKCKGCDCSINESSEKSGLKLLDPTDAK